MSLRSQALALHCPLVLVIELSAEWKQSQVVERVLSYEYNESTGRSLPITCFTSGHCTESHKTRGSLLADVNGEIGGFSFSQCLLGAQKLPLHEYFVARYQSIDQLTTP